MKMSDKISVNKRSPKESDEKKEGFETTANLHDVKATMSKLNQELAKNAIEQIDNLPSFWTKLVFDSRTANFERWSLYLIERFPREH